MAKQKADIIDLAAQGSDTAQQGRMLSNLKKNLSNLLISSQETNGPEIDFGPDSEGNERVLVFKPRIPATAMEALIMDENRLRGLKTWITLTLKPESRDLFNELLDDLPLEALNAIVEAVTEASTPFPSE
jgi:hypothetical protein